jgi:transaldolase / glucose-6-phosphate isomerase
MARENSKLAALRDLGQSIWLDFISRDLLDSGGLRDLVEQGVAGMTTNPTIFDKTVEKGSSHDDRISALTRRGLGAAAITDELILADVREACDLLRPVFDHAGHDDGYVSIEVPPGLAYDTDGTIAEARRLWDAVDRPNLMVKIPGTPPGLPAIRRTIADGLNINVTLMFSRHNYGEVVDAYMAGLEERVKGGDPIDEIRSVASFFVSRVDARADRVVDDLLAGESDAAVRERLEDLRGTLGIANAKLAYQDFLGVRASHRWRRLAERGAHPQRMLWASTSTKDPSYSDVLYVDGLIGPDTVDTMPEETLHAFLDHGAVRRTVDRHVDEERHRVEQAPYLGVDLESITAELQPEGVSLFRDSFEALLASVERKRSELLTGKEGRMSA